MSFTYIIRSLNKTNSDDNSNNCTLQLTGLPSKYNKFQCEVVALMIPTENSTFTTSLFELRASDICINGVDTKKMFNTVGISTNNNTFIQSPYKFQCNNFNNQYINFQLFDDNNQLLKSIYPSDYTITKTLNKLVVVNSSTIIVDNNEGLEINMWVNGYGLAADTYITNITLVGSLYNITLSKNTILPIKQNSSITFSTEYEVTDYNLNWTLILNMTGIE